MKTPESEDPVWELLSHASRTEPGPFFSRDVVREARKSGEPSSSLVGALRDLLVGRRLLLPGGVAGLAVAAVAVFVGLSIQHDESDGYARPASPSLVLEESTSFDPASEMEAVEYLGELMAVTDPGQLSEEALADLFF